MYEKISFIYPLAAIHILELLENSKISYKTVELRSNFDNSRGVLYVASVEEAYIDHYLSRNTFELVDPDYSTKNMGKDYEGNTSPSESEGEIDVFMTRENPNAALSVLLNPEYDQANLRSIADWAYDIRYQSDNHDDYIRVDWQYASGSSSYPADLAVFFFVKHGWLGKWYKVKEKHKVLASAGEFGQYCRSDVRRHKVLIRHNWSNYVVSYGTGCP